VQKTNKRPGKHYRDLSEGSKKEIVKGGRKNQAWKSSASDFIVAMGPLGDGGCLRGGSYFSEGWGKTKGRNLSARKLKGLRVGGRSTRDLL